jgi:hypothetical protein
MTINNLDHYKESVAHKSLVQSVWGQVRCNDSDAKLVYELIRVGIEKDHGTALLVAGTLSLLFGRRKKQQEQILIKRSTPSVWVLLFLLLSVSLISHTTSGCQDTLINVVLPPYSLYFQRLNIHYLGCRGLVPYLHMH